MPISRLTSKGQTTIPKEIRDALRLKPGDRIEFNIDIDGKVQMRALNKDISSLAGMFYDPNRKTVTIEEMNEAIEQAAADRYLRSK
ncbi:type II toxin-antitoxin system PrlF family antitoxin [bacterium]|nr:type II toxin-antitoxin system PrlF family antitoxin [bacterium]